MKYSSNPNDWYFDVWEDKNDPDSPKCLLLSQDPNGLDDQLGSHNLPRKIKDIIQKIGVDPEGELQESVWEFENYHGKQLAIDFLKKEGLNHCKLADHE
jgi:hypothetical protein